MTNLRVALIDGPTYAPLHDLLPAFTARTGIAVEIVARLPHHALNAWVADHHPELDLISTHIKYAPSQAAFLQPLDRLLGTDDLAPFLPGPLAQCRVGNHLLQLPRHTDTRLLVYRTDLVASPPATWLDLPAVAANAQTSDVHGFAFCTQPSGLFGAFFELLASAGGSLFDDDLRSHFVSNQARWALHFLKDLFALAPPASIAWDFADVTQAFLRGELATIGDWPGSLGLIADPRTSAVADRVDVALYPVGPGGIRRVYSGSHSFAITTACRDVPAAVDLLRALTSFEAQLAEAERGAIPARADVAKRKREATTSPLLRRILDLQAETVSDAMLSFPPLATYPQIEERVWPLLAGVLRDEIGVNDALERAQATVQLVLESEGTHHA